MATPLPHSSSQLQSAIGATAQTEITAASSYRRHAVLCVATGGAWSITVEASAETSGSNWAAVTDALSLAAGQSGSLFVEGVYDRLRVNATRTAGTLSTWVVQSDDAPYGRP